MKRNKLIVLFLFLTICAAIPKAKGNYYEEIKLNGKWKFSIGDDLKWAEPGLDDSDWDAIYAPSMWEEEGYQGYNGYAWYRLKLVVPESFKGRNIYLELGYIDDVDEVFLNGTKIGQTGSFPPNYSSAYNSFRKYQVPVDLIEFGGKNVIAVRVYDSHVEGGIVRGNLRLAAGDIAILPDLSLNGIWNFNIGREMKNNTDEIMVPGSWENNGYYNYDGYAVYSKIVDVPAALAHKKLIFLAGRIDDDDQLYINDQFIGETGDYNGDHNTDRFREFRNYFIPDGIVKPGKNLIVIKVVDRRGEGGIIEGNIGFISQDNFIKYWRMKRR